MSFTGSRAMWEAAERFHAVGYFAPEVDEEAAAIGLDGGWANYFATRVAPVGAVGANAVVSTFFYFAPQRVGRYVPAVWAQAHPESVVAARFTAMDRVLRRVLGDTIGDGSVARAARLVRQAVEGTDPVGRVLFAGWAGLEWPDEPHLALWHGCTLLREYRSGSHLIALCREGLTGCEAVVSHAAVGGAPHAWIRAEGGWRADEVDAAYERLGARGWVDDEGVATPQGHAGRARVEQLTDELDWPIWEGLGAPAARELFDLLAELTKAFEPDDQLDWQLRHRAQEAIK